MKRVASISEKKMYIMRWALSKAVDLHDQFFNEAWWSEIRRPSEVKTVIRTRRHLVEALEIFDETWKTKLKNQLRF